MSEKNKPNQDENTTGAANPAKADFLNFDVTFNALSYFTEKVSPEKRSEYVFTQSLIFVDSILTAIHKLNKEIERVSKAGADVLSTADCTEHLVLIAQAFTKEMQKQFHELQSLKEVKTDA